MTAIGRLFLRLSGAGATIDAGRRFECAVGHWWIEPVAQHGTLAVEAFCIVPECGAERIVRDLVSVAWHRMGGQSR